MVEEAGCDINNTLLQDFAGCYAEEQFGCADFVDCAEASEGASPAPAEPTAMPVGMTATAAPTAIAAGERGGITATEGPSSADTGLIGSATPAPSDADDVLGAGEGSGAPRAVGGATKTALAFALGLALVGFELVA